jgi:dihydroxyacid dehydratase/phosphogluconate dehydratase
MLLNLRRRQCYTVLASPMRIFKSTGGVVSMGYDGNTCNMHLNDLAKLVKEGVWDNDLVD